MGGSELFERLEPSLSGWERPSRYIDGEWNAVHRPDAAYRVALVYPDAYELGMANQALQILYARLNALEGVAAERAFVPWKDAATRMRAMGIPLPALESQRALASFDLGGITLPFELTCTNVLETLDLAGIPLRASARRDEDPIVVAGGPCAFNPEPLAPFFDAVLIGEGEDAVVEIVAAHREAIARGEDRDRVLRRLAAVSGVYVPALYEPFYREDGGLAGVKPRDGAPASVEKRVLADLDAHRSPTCPVVPFMDVVHDRCTVEVLRGCTRGCRFCQAGMVYRPVRERDADSVVRDVMANLACTGHEEASLTSLSTTDHSQLEDILRRLTRRLERTGISVSLPSLRVDAFSVEMARLVGGGKKVGLTFAPEAGTQRLRDVVNKGVTEEDLLQTVRSAFEGGWRRVKLYFMVGLPTETDDDVGGIGDLVGKVLHEAREAVPPKDRGSVKVAVSVSTFVPKPHTPFQWEAQLTLEGIRSRQAVLRDAMPRKGVELSWHDPETSFLEGVLARGDRRVADAIEAAWRRGAVFDAWTDEFKLSRWLEAFDEVGLDAVRLTAGRDTDEALPWDHIFGLNP